MTQSTKKQNPHYVDNNKLYEEMRKYKAMVNAAEEIDAPQPKIPEYIGECLIKIAERLSTKPNFINYNFREEMISDGIENCVNYIKNFDPDKSKNPFAYFTQIIYYAFLRRIQKEKKQLYIKHKALENSLVFDELADHDGEGHGDGSNPYVNLESDYMRDFVTNFEAKEEEKKQKRRKKGVEKFFDEDDSE